MADIPDHLPQSLKDSLNGSKAQYVQLGQCGLRVSIPILGCMTFGDRRFYPWALEEEDATKLIKAAYDRGINTWDTANVYSNGVSEKIIGTALKKYDIPRHKVVIMTKISGVVGEDIEVHPKFLPWMLESKDYVNQEGLSRSAVMSQVDACLERLGTPYIDLLQIHRLDPTITPEELMSTLHDLVRSGKVRYIGASSMWATEFAILQFCAEKNGWTKFVSMQGQYNLLYREEEREMIRFCKKTGVGLIPWSPLARGHLSRPRSEQGSTERSAREAKGPPRLTGSGPVDEAIIDRVQQIAEQKGLKMSQVALIWLRGRVTSFVTGLSSERRMDEILDIKGKTLTEEEINSLEELYQPKNMDLLEFYRGYI